MNNLSLEALKSHLFETIEGIKNQNDKKASPNEVVSLEQAKAICQVSEQLIDIAKVQVDALKVVSGMDHLNHPEDILVGMGVVGNDEVKMIS